jgi:hypothetical protein
MRRVNVGFISKIIWIASQGRQATICKESVASLYKTTSIFLFAE